MLTSEIAVAKSCMVNMDYFENLLFLFFHLLVLFYFYTFVLNKSMTTRTMLHEDGNA